MNTERLAEGEGLELVKTFLLSTFGSKVATLSVLCVYMHLLNRGTELISSACVKQSQIEADGHTKIISVQSIIFTHLW